MPPRLARLLAVVLAILLVVAAFALRGALGGDGDAPGGDDPGPTTAPSLAGGVRVLCDDDLGAVCDAVADLPGVASVEVVRAGAAVAELAAGDAPYDAWLTLDPWPGVVAYLEDPSGPAEVPSAPVASARLAALVDPGTSDCTGGTAWACLTEADVNPPVGIPSLGTALGPLVLGAATAGLLATTEFGLNQVGEPVLEQLEVLADEAKDSWDRQLGQILLPGNYSAIVTLGPRAEAQAASPGGKGRGVQVSAIEPAATVGVVLAGVGARGGAAVDALQGLVTDQTVAAALRAEGWSGPAGPSEGLPDADVIYALMEELS